MKKLLFFIVLSGVAFKLKAQSTPKPFDKLFAPNKSSLFDSVPKLSFKQKNDVNALFLPKPKLNKNANLIAALDNMPIAKPAGIWNMPVVHPNGTVVYTTPIVHLPPIVKPANGNSKTNP